MSKFWKNRKIYVSIISAGISWEDLLKEADSLGLKEVALFLTWVDEDERKALFNALERSSIKSIPLVHLKSNERPEEISYLINKFNSKKFNIHPQREFPLKHNLSKFKDKIYVENAYNIFKEGAFREEDIGDWAGVCVDVSHLEGEKNISKDNFEKTMEIIKKSKVGWNHISPFKAKSYQLIKQGIKSESVQKDIYRKWHLMENLSELDYLKKYPSWIFSDTIALEMKNSIKEQLEAKKYIIELLNKK